MRLRLERARGLLTTPDRRYKLARLDVIVHDYAVGILYYATHEFEFDDVVLAHLQVVITQKLRRREAFFLNWRRSVNVGSGRMSVWISAEVPVSFSGSALRQQDLNREWIDAMTDASNTTSGIDVLGIAKDPSHHGGGQRRSKL